MTCCKFLPARLWLLPLIWVLQSASPARTEIIDLTKPVSESLAVDKVHWKFDHDAGSVISNSARSGPVYDGVAESGDFESPEFASGVDLVGSGGFRDAIELRGESPGGQNPSIGWVGGISDSLLDLVEEDFTGGLWIQFNQVNDQAQTVVLLNRGTFGLPHSFSILLLHTKSGGGVYDWHVQVEIGGQAEKETLTSAALPAGSIVPGEWFHLGFTCKYVGSQGTQISLFLNGRKLESLEFEQTIAIANAQRKLVIGERAASSFYSLFDGKIDDFFLSSGIHDFKELPVSNRSER